MQDPADPPEVGGQGRHRRGQHHARRSAGPLLHDMHHLFRLHRQRRTSVPVVVAAAG